MFEVTPIVAKRRAAVQILGRNFGKSAGKVTFGTVRATVRKWSDNVITCVVPASLPIGAYSITVTDLQGQSTLENILTVTK